MIGTTRAATTGAIDNLRGLAWMLVAVLMAAIMAVAVRALSADIDSRAIVLVRAVIIVALMGCALPVSRTLRQLRFTRPWLHVARGALIGVATQLGFYTLSHVPLATASVLFFTAPIFATILAATLQGEQVGARRWAAVAAGFAGALVILRPGVQGLDAGMLAALASSACYAVALSQSRRIAEADGPVAALVSANVMTLVVSIPAALPVLALPSTPVFWTILMVLVAAGTLRGLADIQAYRHGEASVLAPVTYLRIILVGLAGYLLFDEVIDGPTLVGAAIIVASTLYIARREAVRRRRLRAATRAPAGPDA
ncbi:DMT family transporter [Halovulum marinum]|uniref:DMT family transporter n=1 Tax=Halovulum marinum TaxID=2662447 RepID=UPI002D79540A|nr:DMT family transporter [Halovulum marinum]